MLKRLTLQVPKYLKKFLEGEFDGEGGVVHVEKWSEIGSLIHLVSRSYPFPLTIDRPSGTTITISYYCREKSYDIPPDKMPHLVRQLDEIFRRSLNCEVRKVHEMAGGNYGPYVRTFIERYVRSRNRYLKRARTYVRTFIERYGIIADVDVEFETMRKIYRDYLARIDRKNAKNICAKSPASA